MNGLSSTRKNKNAERRRRCEDDEEEKNERRRRWSQGEPKEESHSTQETENKTNIQPFFILHAIEVGQKWAQVLKTSNLAAHKRHGTCFYRFLSSDMISIIISRVRLKQLAAK